MKKTLIILLLLIFRHNVISQIDSVGIINHFTEKIYIKLDENVVLDSNHIHLTSEISFETIHITKKIICSVYNRTNGQDSLLSSQTIDFTNNSAPNTNPLNASICFREDKNIFFMFKYLVRKNLHVVKFDFFDNQNIKVKTMEEFITLN